ncbi:glycosyltransferase family 4 protein [candidate division WOR-3 bacterium]|nr:glycosyltransferase family 4 protein [candidate division WOR-3 bacterium]
MKILITVEFYYPKIGGVELWTQTIAEYFASRRHKVYIATTYLENRKTRNLNRVNILGFNIKGNKVKGIKELTKGDIKRYKKLLLEGGFDIILQHAAQTWHTDLMFDIIDKVRAKKILIPCGYSGLSTPLRKLIYYKYFKKLPKYLRKYDLLIYHCEGYRDYKFGERHGLNKYKLIPIGINLKEFQEVYKSDKIKFREKYKVSSKYIILNVSNHYKLKGHYFAIKTLEKLLREGMDVSLLIIGNPAIGTKQNCYHACLKYSQINEKFKVLTDMPRKDVIKAYTESDVFLLSSKIEYFPVVILESMAGSLPYVSTNIGCVRNMGKGIIVHDPRGATEAIRQVLSDKKLRDSIVKHNKGKIEHEYEINDVLKLYEKALIEA